MKNILKRYMEEGCDVRIITTATRNGESVGITGKIIEVTDDPVNPAVVVKWTSNKPNLSSSTGTVAYSIPHVIIAQKWESRTMNSNSSSLASSDAQWQGVKRPSHSPPF